MINIRINIKGCKPTEDLFASEFHLRILVYIPPPAKKLVMVFIEICKCYSILQTMYWGQGVLKNAIFWYGGLENVLFLVCGGLKGLNFCDFCKIGHILAIFV